MKRFLVEASVFAALQVAIAFGWLVYRYQHDDSYLRASAFKERLLATAPGPRIVFVGGSNLTFGLDSEMVERRLGRHPVNMGLLAGFGLRYLLRETKASLRSGDVVVLAPEYSHFLSEDYARGQTVPTYWGSLLWLNPRSLRFARKEVFQELFLRRTGFDLLLNGYRQVGDRNLGDVYRRHNFNRYGDLELPEDRANEVFTSTQPPVLAPNRAATESMARYARRFVEWCRAHDIQVFLAWTPYLRDNYLANARTLDEVDEIVARTLRIEVVVRPREAALPTNCFFDTDYHLNRSGRRERTEFLCARLARALEQTGPARPGRALR